MYVLTQHDALIPCSDNGTSKAYHGAPLQRYWAAATGASGQGRPNRDLHSFPHSGTLELKEVESSDMGTYSCKVTWVDERGVKQTITHRHNLKGNGTTSIVEVTNTRAFMQGFVV